MKALMAMALAVGCRAEPSSAPDAHCGERPCSEADGVDTDSSATTDCENPEVWCDGIDQDCDGADATDEIPYDGIDQNCDGSDLIDVDGDGFEAAAVGGDDCDDENADAYPGAAEALGDGADNDCDGYVDELRACADGTGDALTIQEAVDAAADGGTVEICPGRWTEHAVVSDRVLTLRGGGDMPGDTILDASGGTPVITAEGNATDLTLDWLGLQGDDADDQLVGFTDSPTVSLRRIDISDNGEATAGIVDLSGVCVGHGSLTLSLSRVRGEVWLAGWCVRGVSIETPVTARKSAFPGGPDPSKSGVERG